jgi:hypothetical protein
MSPEIFYLEPLAKPLQIASSVIPEKAGIQCIQRLLDPVFTGVTNSSTFARGSLVT